ncbi:GerAB/ArcD/ProY family transporter [Desulfotomaculum copahuensis]|uniref:GerAB/ArcD/ProY family transporter n=1 Tax=Desulfotomaculum copahuensis TaxID=1838280 RepID=UPI000ACC7ABC|nr:endospore germination permease [Desulfotomaculum copahuensis]
MDKTRISDRQTIFLLVNLVGATALIALPVVASGYAGRDAWMTAVLGTVNGFLVAFLVGALGREFPGQTIVQYAVSILGKIPGKAVGLLYLFFFIQPPAIVVREFGELLAVSMLPTTPQILFAMLIVSVSAYALYYGLEVLARVNELLFPLIIVLFLFILFSVAEHMEPANLLPVMEHGIKPVLLASLGPASWRGEIILLAMFLPMLARPERGARDAVISTLAIGMVLFVAMLVITMVFGASTARLSFSVYELARLSTFVATRLDAIWMIIWIVGIFAKIGLWYYCAVLGTAQWLNLKDYRILIAPIGVIIVAVSMSQYNTSTDMINFIAGPWISFAYLFEWFIPLILLICSRFKSSVPAAGG